MHIMNNVYPLRWISRKVMAKKVFHNILSEWESQNTMYITVPYLLKYSQINRF